MKSYNIVIGSVKSKLKYNSEEHTMGYIWALLDWRIINQKTFDELEIFVRKGDWR